MDGKGFFEEIGSHPELEWLGVKESDSAAESKVFVSHRPSGARYAVALSTVLEGDWRELEAVLTGRRQPSIMTHLSRVVGYFSQVKNWNRSKLAELRDRRKGSYVLPKARAPRGKEPVARPAGKEPVAAC